MVATCRNPASAPALHALQEQHPQQLTVLQVDVTNTEQIKQASKVVGEKFGHLDLLINSAGMLHPKGRGETSLKDVSAEVINYSFAPVLTIS